jgi:hypothetical protein
MAKKPETKFTERLQPLLAAIPGSWWVKVQQVGKRGTPDILGSIRGRFVALELKKDDQTEPSPIQVYTLQKIEDSGGYAAVVSPENWREIYRTLCQMSHVVVD